MLQLKGEERNQTDASQLKVRCHKANGTVEIYHLSMEECSCITWNMGSVFLGESLLGLDGLGSSPFRHLMLSQIYEAKELLSITVIMPLPGPKGSPKIHP